jgi:hypothetical protein
VATGTFCIHKRSRQPLITAYRIGLGGVKSRITQCAGRKDAESEKDLFPDLEPWRIGMKT